MKTVEYDGDRYLVIEQSAETTLVRDPETGDERSLPTDELAATGGPPIAIAARSIPEAPRRILIAVHSERTLGLLVELDECGPLSVREILRRSDRCESDLHGTFGELRAAGLLESATIDGERGYATTELASDGLVALRSDQQP